MFSIYFILKVVTSKVNVQFVFRLERLHLLTIGRRKMFYVVGKLASIRTVVFVVKTAYGRPVVNRRPTFLF